MAEDSVNLSEYFTDNPPSFFDDIAQQQTSVQQTTAAATKSDDFDSSIPIGITITDQIIYSPYMSPGEIEFNAPEFQEEMKYPEYARIMWDANLRINENPLKLTTPGILTPNDLPDKIAEAVVEHLGEHELEHRKMLTVDQVTQDERGLRELIVANCYREAVNLTSRLLTIYGQGYGSMGKPTKHTPHSLQLWFTRFALLVKLGEITLVQAEAEPFEDLCLPDMFYEFYPKMYKKKKGSMACFSFRLLIAEIPIYFGKPIESLDLLTQLVMHAADLRTYFNDLDDGVGALVWRRREERIMHSLINCALLIRKYRISENVLQMLLSDCDIKNEYKRALYSTWGRIYLHGADIFGAEKMFATARRIRGTNNTPDLRDLVDKGLVAVAKNDYREAYSIFQKALHLDSGNIMILNNMAVCLVFAGRLKDAIKLYERAIEINPSHAINEKVLVNLSTLYELESNNCKAKKLNLLRLLNRYKPDINMSMELCLKLQ